MARKTETAAITEREIFPSKLRLLFQDSGRSRAELADFLGVTTSSIGYYTTGQSKPSLEAVAKIAEFFQVSTDYLLTDTKTKSVDVDTRGVCNYTGLSEEAVEALHWRSEKAAQISTIDYLLRDDKFISYLSNFLWCFSFENLQDTKYYMIPTRKELVRSLPDVAYARLMRYFPLLEASFKCEHGGDTDLLDKVLHEYYSNNIDLDAAILIADDPELYHAFGRPCPDEMSDPTDDNDYHEPEMELEDIVELERARSIYEKEHQAAMERAEKARENIINFLYSILKKREVQNGEHQTD